MWLLLLFLLGAAPAWAEDLGELSANPIRLFGSFGLSGLSGISASSGWSGSSNNRDRQVRPEGPDRLAPPVARVHLVPLGHNLDKPVEQDNPDKPHRPAPPVTQVSIWFVLFVSSLYFIEPDRPNRPD